MIASLIAEFFVLFFLYQIKSRKVQLTYQILATIWLAQVAATATYLAWKYLP